jgi:hypothetical protein
MKSTKLAMIASHEKKLILLNLRFGTNRSVSLPLSLSISFSLLVKGSYCISRFMSAFGGKNFFEIKEAIAIADLNKQ